jgi:hypothetical protein
MSLSIIEFSVILVLVVIAIIGTSYVAFVNSPDWVPFKIVGETPIPAKATPPGWGATGKGKTIADLMFYDCVFTIETPDGRTMSRDVTITLNSMAMAYKGAFKPPAMLSLDSPLSALSFPIKDAGNIARTREEAAKWTNMRSRLTGKVRTL